MIGLLEYTYTQAATITMTIITVAIATGTTMYKICVTSSTMGACKVGIGAWTKREITQISLNNHSGK